MVGIWHTEIAGQPQGYGVAHQGAVDIIGKQRESLGLGQAADRLFLRHFEAVGLLVHIPRRVAAPTELHLLLLEVVVHAVSIHI